MASTLYPAVLERAEKKTFAVWFPDFPDCVAVGRTQDEAVEKAQEAVAVAVESLAEQDKPLPPATPIENVARPKGFLAFVMVSIAPPDPSERVNVYLPKRLIGRADARAAELGMSRSSFFGFALSVVLGAPLLPGMHRAGAALARSLRTAVVGPDKPKR
ncbi:MAG: type II toxin-antitoxin system HicB family antitoxin [Rhizomicrobium sp.]